MLPFLPTLKGLGTKVKNVVKDYFKPDEDGIRIRDFISNLPKAQLETAQDMGQSAFRGFAAGATGLQDLGNNFLAAIDPKRNIDDIKKEFGFGDFTPTGKFQQDLFGTSEKITPSSFGKETRGNLGGSKLDRIDPMLGFVAGFADAIPGASQADEAVETSLKGIRLSKNVYTKLVQRYGPTIAKQIDELGDVDKAMSALIKGGEGKVASMLNVDTMKVAQQKILDSFEEITKAQKETEAMRSFESARRLSQAEDIMKSGKGEQAAIDAKRALKGEMPRADLPQTARNRLKDNEVNSLFENIRTTDNLRGYERFAAFDGLGKVLGDPFFEGKIPTKGEIRALEKAFGEPFARAINNMSTTGWERFKTGAVDLANVPRALMASMDLSAPFRQGLVLSIDQPKIAARAFGQMFKYFGDEKYFNAAMDSIHNSPMQQLRSASGLDITDVSGGLTELSSKEEGFMSNLAEKIPVIGRLVKGSERSFAGFLNKLRADVFDDVAKEYMAGGITPKNAPEEFKGLATFINTATGRGELTGNFRKAAPLLNSFFFSPRFMASRLQMLNPAWYMKLPPQARKAAARSMLKLAGTGIAIAAVAKLGGAKVETDPRSSDFGKIRFGNTRYDLYGGFQQWMVFATRLITGESKAAGTGKIRDIKGDKFPYDNRLDVVNRFIQGKLAPIPAMVADILRGQTLIGEDVSTQGQLFSKLVPIYIQDIIEAAKDEGAIGVAKVIPSIFGIGVQSFDTKSEKTKGGLPKLPSLPTLPSLPSLPSLPKL